MITKPTIYTEEFVLKELQDMYQEVLEDTELVFIGQLFEKRSYSRQRYSEWANKFKDNAEISDAIKRLENLLETRLVIGGLKNKLNPTLTIFTLKNKHEWIDKATTVLEDSFYTTDNKLIIEEYNGDAESQAQSETEASVEPSE